MAVEEEVVEGLHMVAVHAVVAVVTVAVVEEAADREDIKN